MIRLSKKGWNNVLIFSMLLMIMVFNGMHKKLGGGASEDESVLLLPEDSLLLTLKFNRVAIERIGQGWRANPSLDLDNQALSALMALWMGHKAQLQQDDNEAKVITQGIMPEHFVIATLAGKEDGAVYAFYPQLETVWIHDQQQSRWLKMSLESLHALIPPPLK